MSSEQQNHNALTAESIPALVRSIAIPACVGFFFNTMYNVVDTYFAGYVGTAAVAALAVSFPIFFIIIAIGSGVGTGTTALIGHPLGEGNRIAAENYARQAISFTAILSVFMTIAGILSANFLSASLGAIGEQLLYATTYLNVIFAGCCLFSFQFVLNAILNAQGDTKTYRNVLIVAFFLNCILDPWFVMGGFGVPPMGVFGIALATIIANAGGAAYMFIQTKKTGLLNFTSMRDFLPQLPVYKEIAWQGFPSSASMMTVAIGIFTITYFISPFGQAAVAAYGIATRVEQILLLPAIGLTIAALTLTAQNAGAKRFDRVKEVAVACRRYITFVMTASAVLIFFGAKSFFNFFSDDPAVAEIGIPYLRIAAFITWGYGLLFLTDSVLRGLKRPMFPLIMGLFRQIILPLTVFWTFIHVFELGIMGVWYGVFLIVWGAAAVSVWYLKHTLMNLTSQGNGRPLP